MFRVREAIDEDAEKIRDLFHAAYGDDYAYKQFYDPTALKKMIFSEETVFLVAEEEGGDGRALGTASLMLDHGAFSDLLGEFGRLVVHPDARGKGLGNLLMVERLERASERLHAGVVEARAVHPFSQKIARKHGFAAAGFLPVKHQFAERESIALMTRLFGDALALRRNHPSILPEAYHLAAFACEGLGLDLRPIVDEEAPAYHSHGGFELEEMGAEGYAKVLRIQRGQGRHREIFGPMHLHYGYFKLKARRSNYLLAKEKGRVVGAVGFTLDSLDRTVRVFELITLDEEAIRFLLEALERKCREEWNVAYIEADVSAYEPRMQRTLLALGFLPVAYLPAMVFHKAERLDVLKMARLLVPAKLGHLEFVPECREAFEIVMAGFRRGEAGERLEKAIQSAKVFRNLSPEQAGRLAGVCLLERFETGAKLLAQGEDDGLMRVLLEGFAEIARPGGATEAIEAGESAGALSFLTRAPHSATVVAKTPVETASLRKEEFAELIRQRPDIGAAIYRNLAEELGRKLQAKA